MNHFVYCINKHSRGTLTAKERFNMSRGKHFKHKEKGHPGNLPKTASVEGKDHTQYGKSVSNILPEETFKNRE